MLPSSNHLVNTMHSSQLPAETLALLRCGTAIPARPLALGTSLFLKVI